jgi:hypothetical protein
MITSLLLLITLEGSPDPKVLFEPTLLETSQYQNAVTRYTSVNKDDFDYAGTSIQTKLRFDCRIFPGSVSDYQSLEFVADINAKYTHQTPSGAPLQFGYIVSNTGVLVGHAFSGAEISRVQIIPPPENFVRPGKTGPMPQQIDYNELLPFVERLLRYHCASLAGYYSKVSSESVTLNGSSFAKRIDRESGTDYVNLRDIATFLKFSISDIIPENSIGLKISKPDQESLEFYMATNTFKKGEQYLQMRDSTILINGELWVPTTVLDHLE